jgi:hypothetical protein
LNWNVKHLQLSQFCWSFLQVPNSWHHTYCWLKFWGSGVQKSEEMLELNLNCSWMCSSVPDLIESCSLFARLSQNRVVFVEFSLQSHRLSSSFVCFFEFSKGGVCTLWQLWFIQGQPWNSKRTWRSICSCPSWNEHGVKKAFLFHLNKVFNVWNTMLFCRNGTLFFPAFWVVLSF